MAYDQLRITSINAKSGIFQIRLNFDDNRLWTTLGSVATMKSEPALLGMSTFTSSRLTSDLKNALGNVTLEFNDFPELTYTDSGGTQTGSIIRECFEAARANGYKVHCIIARYSSVDPPVFQEFIFAGSVAPSEITEAHRFIRPSVRRNETLSCEFSPAVRFALPLSEIQWLETDMETPRPMWLAVVDEPGLKVMEAFALHLPTRLSDWIINGVSIDFGDPGGVRLTARESTKDLAYGSHPLSVVVPDPGDYRDNVYDGPFFAGNWPILLSNAINKLCDAIDVVWDGNFPTGVYGRKAHWDNTSNLYIDDGECAPSEWALNWNYAFGFNPLNGEAFKSPITWDWEQQVADALSGIAVLLKSRLDISGEFDSDGRPYVRFIGIGETSTALPIAELDVMPDSTEDSIIADSDGVEVTRRGFEGSVIAPSNAKKPVKIEIPFGTHAVAYETGDPFDASRCTINSSLPFRDQYKCGQRSAIADDASGETTAPLNPYGWGVGAFIFYYDSETSNTHFPIKHGQDNAGGTYGYDNDTETLYQAGGWAGYYPVHAIYDIDRADLTEEERRERQRNPRISYALAYGRYIHGERRRLTVSFNGVVAPNWSDIQTGQTYSFTPVDTPVTYVAVSIERDIMANVTTIDFEEVAPDVLPITYRETGDGNKGSGSIGGTGTNESSVSTDNPGIHKFSKRTVKFYSGGVVQKTLIMDCFEYYDSTNIRTVVQLGFPTSYDEAGSDDYGQNAMYFFHYHGDTDNGDVEIVGVSQTGVPDYFASAITQYKHGTADSDITYSLFQKYWSEDQNDFLVQRPLEAANQKRRLYVAGRFEVDTTGGTWGTFTWKSLVSADWPISNDDCKTDVDLGYLAASGALPTLAGAGDYITITWGSRYKPVTIMAQAWGFSPLDTVPGAATAHAWQVGANPVMNQLPTANGVKIGFWLNNLVLGVWQHITKASYADINGEGALDLMIVEFWGELEIIGENAP